MPCTEGFSLPRRCLGQRASGILMEFKDFVEVFWRSIKVMRGTMKS